MGNKQTRLTTTLQDDINECVSPEGNIDMEQLQSVWRKWEETACNIAILGASGVGKSTLINNLLGVPPEPDESMELIKADIAQCNHANPATCKHSYAPTGSEECTAKPTPYTMRESNAFIWDLPGYGAQLYANVETYWTQLEIEKYSVFIWVFRDNRVREDDKLVVQYLLQQGKRVIWVRSFFDAAMRGRKADESGIERNKSQTLLTNLGVESPMVFCVSGNYVPLDETTTKFVYDLDDLKEAIVMAVPDSLKIPLALVFQGYSEQLILEKYESVRKLIAVKVLKLSAVGFGASAIPLYGPILYFKKDLDYFEDFKKKIAMIYGFTLEGKLVSNFNLDDKEQLNIQNRIKAGIRHKSIFDTQSEAAFFAMFIPVLGTLAATVMGGNDHVKEFHKLNRVFRDAALEVVRLLQERV